MEQGTERYMPEIRETPKLLLFLSVVYTALSYFEIYLPGIAGSSTRYLIFIISILFLYLYHGKIRSSKYVVLFFLWFVFKFISIAWSNQSNDDVARTALSQIGMLLLFSSMCGQVHEEKYIGYLVKANYACSAAFGILTLAFHRSYISETFVARQVLTLFGNQNDPNNCAAFLSVGIAMAAYSLVAEKRMKLVNIAVILVNSYGIMLTGSRMGFIMLAMVAVILILMPNIDQTFVVNSFIKKLVITSAVLVVGIWLIYKYLPATTLNRLLAFDEYSAGSGRAVKWEQALELIKQRPLFGWGWGGYTVTGSVIHNTYLTVLCDIGIFGFILFMTPIGKLLFKLAQNKYQLAMMILLTGIVPAFFVDSINKRYFWNSIIIAIMMLENYQYSGKTIGVWSEQAEG